MHACTHTQGHINTKHVPVAPEAGVSAYSWKQALTRNLAYLYHIDLNQVLENKVFLKIIAKIASRF